MLAEYLSKYKAGLSLTFAFLFSFSSLIWQNNIFSGTFNHAVYFLDFFTETFHSIGSGFSRVLDSYGSYQNLKRERDALRGQLKENSGLKIELAQLKVNNAKLRHQLNLPQLHEYPVIQAEVVSQDPDNWFRTIIVNKGRNDGVKPYMPVIAYQLSDNFEIESIKKQKAKTSIKETVNTSEHDASIVNLEDDASEIDNELSKMSVIALNQSLKQGVVGKVIQVNANSSRILPITDQYSRLGVLLNNTGHWAMLTGQSPHGKYPQLEYLSLAVFLNKNDLLVTSGGDGIFPKGLMVGYIFSDIKRLGGFQKAKIKPILDLKKLEYVMIIKKPINLKKNNFPPLKKSKFKRRRKN